MDMRSSLFFVSRIGLSSVMRLVAGLRLLLRRCSAGGSSDRVIVRESLGLVKTLEGPAVR